MKKLLFTLASMLLWGFFAQAQISGTISGTVLDSLQNPVQGVAVFNLGKSQNWNGQLQPYQPHTYTDGNGNYSINYWGMAPADSIAIGVVDCHGSFTVRNSSVGGSGTNRNIQISCVPGACDAVTMADTTMLTNRVFFFAIALMDSSAVLQGPAAVPVTHNWSITGVTSSIKNIMYDGPNEDSVMYKLSALPPNFEYCYQRTANCTQICDTVGVIAPPPAPFCNAHFYVDTVNSVNFNGQIVMWENSSTTGAGANIVEWYWTFGDGGFSYQQYPAHTYSDTNVYEICLKITAVNGQDTCVSTYCDSVGFDANGNLHKSTGFTVKVIDPATVGSPEDELQSRFSLYPNPANGKAVLSWDNTVHVDQVEIISISGQLLRSLEPNQAFVELTDLKQGAYFVRIRSKEGTTSLKMIVE